MAIFNFKQAPLKLATLAVCGVFIVGCSDDDDDPAPVSMSSMMGSSEASSSSEAVAMNIVEVAAANGSFTLLLDAATRAGIANALIDNSNLTVFAPTDAAFEKAGITADVLAGMSEEDLASLANTLTYHVHPGDTPVLAEAALMLSGERIPMFTQGMDKAILTVVGEGENAKLFINNAQVIIPDVMASNGVIHVIDNVIMPPMQTLATGSTITQVVQAAAADADAPEFTRLLAEVAEANLATALGEAGERTVFAPNDAAFAKLGDNADITADVLLYHVIPDNIDSLAAFNSQGASPATAQMDTVDVNLVDGHLYVNASKVIGTDVITDNGIIHTIDTVLLPPVAETVTAAVLADNSFSELRNLLGLAALLPDGTSLTDALMDTTASYTVFAPTNAAFAEFAMTDTYTALASDPEALRDALLYHVFAGKRIFSPEAIAASGGALPMLANGSVNVELREGEGLFINNAKVEATDILTGNGVVHRVDAVILPPADSAQ